MTTTTTAHDAQTAAADACHAPFRQALESIHDGLAKGLLDKVEAAANAHADLVAETDLHGNEPEAWEDRSKRLVDYRRRLAAEVLEPIRRSFGSSGHSDFVIVTLRDVLIMP